MRTPDELRYFLEQGYLHVRGAFTADEVGALRAAYHAAGAEASRKLSQPDLLRQRAFIDLLEHPELYDRHHALFGEQTQLLSFDSLYQGPRSVAAERYWHRDFHLPGDIPLSVNSIIYLDDMTSERGRTAVLPGSHRGLWQLQPEQRGARHPDEVEVPAAAGDLVLLNSAIWHSGGQNRTSGERRALYVYFGWWWLKRYDLERELPAECLKGASSRRLRLLGLDRPQYDLHMFEQSGTILETIRHGQQSDRSHGELPPDGKSGATFRMR